MYGKTFGVFDKALTRYLRCRRRSGPQGKVEPLTIIDDPADWRAADLKVGHVTRSVTRAGHLLEKAREAQLGQCKFHMQRMTKAILQFLKHNANGQHSKTFNSLHQANVLTGARG